MSGGVLCEKRAFFAGCSGGGCTFAPGVIVQPGCTRICITLPPWTPNGCTLQAAGMLAAAGIVLQPCAGCGAAGRSPAVGIGLPVPARLYAMHLPVDKKGEKTGRQFRKNRNFTTGTGGGAAAGCPLPARNKHQMMEDVYLQKLERRGVKPTAMRLLILRTMLDTNRAVAQHELEEILLTVDKSTISRTIALFLDHHLIHAVDDGSGALKYAVCSDDCTCSVSDQHVHFYCERCRRAFCFRQQAVPVVRAPEGFVLTGVNYVLKGLCPACAAKLKDA